MKTLTNLAVVTLAGSLGIAPTAMAQHQPGQPHVTNQAVAQATADQDAAWGDCPERPAMDDMWGMSQPANWGPAPQCQDITVAADHSNPAAGETTIKAARIAAGKPGEKVGTLVVNYGLSGTSSIHDVQDMWELLPHKVTDQFDILAIDSRAASSEEQCFTKAAEQQATVAPLSARPKNKGQRLNLLSSSKEFAKACAENLSPGLLTMSSETYAHDLEATRKALKIDSFNIYASEGHGLAGQYYVNMFPESARAVIIDGVLDGQRVSKAGLNPRSDSAKETGLRQATESTLAELFARCDAVGPKKCYMAAPHDKFPTAQSKLDETMRVATEEGIYDQMVIEVYEDDELIERIVIDINMDEHEVIDLVEAGISGDFISPELFDEILHSYWLAAIGELPEPVAIKANNDTAGHVAALKRLMDRDVRLKHASNKSFGGSYDANPEGRIMAQCNDSSFSGDIFKAAAHADASARKSPIFGPAFSWNAIHCHEWGPSKTPRQQSFNATTKHPVLFLNAKHSSKHHHGYATEAVGRYPNAALITDEGWTNASYGYGGCVDDAVHAYLLDPTSAKSASCASMAEPFTTDLPEGDGPQIAGKSGLGNRTTVASLLAQMPEQQVLGDKRPTRRADRVSKKQ